MRRLMKKSQLNQVFTYLMIILVIGVLVIIGVSAWKSIISAKCSSQKIIFQKDILSLIDEYSDKGTVKEEVVTLPCEAREVCFVDSKCYEENPPWDCSIGNIPEEYNIIRSAVDSKTQNIFVRTDFLEPVGFAPKLSLKEEDRPFKCYVVKNERMKLLFTGLGRKTQVSLP